jgi:myosin heavy subunit
MVITTKAPLVSTMAPVDVIPVKVTRSTGSPIEETNPPVHPVAVHIASEPAPESAPNDQYKSLAKMVINQAVGSVEKELKEGIEKREKALERKLSLSAEKTLEERMHKIVRRDLAAFAKQAGDVEQADSTTEAEAEEAAATTAAAAKKAAATTAAAAKKAAATTGAAAKKAAATTAAAAKKMEPKTKVDTSLHAALPAQNMKKKAAVYHVQLAHSAHTLTGKALHAPTAAAVLPKSQQTMLRQQVIEQALHKAEKTVAQRVAADVGAAMAATRKSKHNLQAELAKAQHTVESRVAADLHHAMRAGPKAEITSLSSHTGSEASTDDLLGFADQSF